MQRQDRLQGRGRYGRHALNGQGRTGQSSMEFVVLFGFTMFLFIVFFILIQKSSFSALTAQKQARMDQLKSMISSEFDIAAKASYGYSRTFIIPDTIDGTNYTIELDDNQEIVVMQGGVESVTFLHTPIIGNISKGANLISKPFGTIYVTNVSS